MLTVVRSSLPRMLLRRRITTICGRRHHRCPRLACSGDESPLQGAPSGPQGLLSAYWACLLACRGLSCTAPLTTLTLNWLAPSCGKQRKKQLLCWDSQLLTSTWSPIAWNSMTQSGSKACASLRATGSTAVTLLGEHGDVARPQERKYWKFWLPQRNLSRTNHPRMVRLR